MSLAKSYTETNNKLHPVTEMSLNPEQGLAFNSCYSLRSVDRCVGLRRGGRGSGLDNLRTVEGKSNNYPAQTLD